MRKYLIFDVGREKKEEQEKKKEFKIFGMTLEQIPDKMPEKEEETNIEENYQQEEQIQQPDVQQQQKQGLEKIITFVYNKVKKLNGFLPAIGINYVEGNANGLLIAGVVNVVEGSGKGIMIGGLGNFLGECRGKSGKKYSGVIAALMNGADFISGIMIGGSNVAINEKYLIQLGLYNRIYEADGPYLQLGLFNRSERRILPLINFGKK